MLLFFLTFPLEALLSQDADQSQELCYLFEVKHCGVIQLYNGQRLFIVSVAVAVVLQSVNTPKHIQPLSIRMDDRIIYCIFMVHRSAKHKANSKSFSPVNTRDVNDDIDHVTAELV